MNQAIQITITNIADTSITVNCKGISDYKKWEYTVNARDTSPTWITAYDNPVVKLKDETLNIYGLTPSTGYNIQVRAQTDDDQPFDGSKIMLVSTSALTPQISLTITDIGDYWVKIAASAHGMSSKLWKYSLNDGNWISITDNFHTACAFEVSNLTGSTDYTIQVKAVKQVDLNSSAVEIFSKKMVFTTAASHNEIEIEERSHSTDSASFNIYTNGISYTNWQYKLDNGSYNDFTPSVIDGVNVLILESPSVTLRSGHTYTLQLKALYSGSHVVESDPIYFHTDEIQPRPLALTLLWIDNHNASFHVENTGSASRMVSKAYAIAPNPSLSSPTDWVDIPDSRYDIDFTIDSLDPDTYYPVVVCGITDLGDREYTSNTIIIKMPPIPESYDVNVDWEYANSTSARFHAYSDAHYNIWEYSIKMNPTENDWVRIGNYTPGEDMVRFTIDSLEPNTEYVLRLRCKETGGEYTYSNPMTFETTKETIPAYIPSENAIIHKTIVDFIRRPITDPVKVVQYDQDCPIVAVSLYKDGEPFEVPEDENVYINIRFGKPDRTFVYNPAEGLNADRTIAYFKITKQMTVYHGIFNPVVEYVVGDKVAASGSFQIRIDRNPIQNGDIESSVEYKTVQEYAEEASHAAEMLQNVSADAVELPQHAPAYANYDPETGTFHFGLPAGGDGGVESVNGKTGVVEIDAGDIPYDSEETVEEKLQNLEESKANIDGYYENLGAGTADQLVSTTYEEDSVPYSFRTSGGSADVGDLEYDEIVGGTIAWNQLIQNGNFVNADGWTGNRVTVSVANNKATLTMPANVGTSSYLQKTNFTDVLLDEHKYLISAFLTPSRNTAIRFTLVGNSSDNKSITANIRNFCSTILTKGTGSGGLIIYVNRGGDLEENDTVIVENVQCFDLTQMFGPDISDYIYSLETETTGNGIAYFRKLFPNAYYTTNTGTLMSVKAASHKMIGFNAWDEEWELGAMNDFTGANSASSSNIRSKNYIRVVPNTTYSIECASGHRYYLFYYDADKNYLGRNDANNKGTFLSDGRTYYRTMASNCHYVRFFYDATSYADDFCMHLTWSGYRDGEYEAYKERNYPLDSSLELRGIPKLDASNNLYYDGDVYESNGTVNRRFREIILDGSTTGRKIASDNQVITSGSKIYAYVVLDVYGINTNTGGGLISNKFITRVASTEGSIYITTNGHNLVMVNYDQTLDTAEKWNTWLASNNVTVVYEVAEPISQVAEPFTSPQWVDDFGTEEYIDYDVQQGDRDVSVPVGHNTKYLQNLRDKLQHLPNLPDPLEDGDYKIHVSGHQMSLIPDDGSGLYDVSFEGYVSLISGDYTWFCSKSNRRILDAIDAGSVVRASVVVDNMPDNTMYLCQYSNLDGLVSFYGMALLPVNGTNTICYVQLYQSTENSWSSIITPIQ